MTSELEPAPSLVDPVMIAAFEGWNDAGEAATGVVDHLIDEWGAVLIGEIEPDDYYDYQVNRPTIAYDDSDERVITWPTTRFYAARPLGADRDLLLVRGIEPNMRWRRYCSELLDTADQVGASLIVTLGALLADTPHTRPVPLSGHVSGPELAERFGVERSRYEGPTGITGVLTDAAVRRDIPCASLWAAVPHYVPQPPSPKATVALLSRLEDMLDVSISVSDLEEQALAWEETVDDLAREDGEIAEYVEALERARDSSDLPEASGEAIAREFERYLKRRHHDSD
ncbi:MAG: PAC2 family protein [Nocardioidaceae bacterium]